MLQLEDVYTALLWLSPFRHVYFAPCLRDGVQGRQGFLPPSKCILQKPLGALQLVVGSGPCIISQGNRSSQA